MKKEQIRKGDYVKFYEVTRNVFEIGVVKRRRAAGWLYVKGSSNGKIYCLPETCVRRLMVDVDRKTPYSNRGVT